jgi:hypothetical protein
MKTTLGALGAAIFMMSASAASAVEIQCAKRDQLAGLLAKKYSEQPVGSGTISDDRYMQLYVSASGSWTVVVTGTTGESCIVAAGRNWESLPQLVKAEPSA